MKQDKELLFSVTLADCDVQTKRGSGKGGQNRNKRDTAVRIVHRASGAVGEASDERSQWQNKKLAWHRLVESPKFKVWLNQEWWVRQGLPSPEEQVQKLMQSENIRTEVKNDKGRWTVSDELVD